MFGHEHYVDCCALAPAASYQYLAPIAGLQKPPPASSTVEFIASGSRGKTIKLWDSRGSCFLTLVGHDNWVRGLVFHPGGRYLVSVADDKSPRCWDLSQGAKCVKVLKALHSHFISGVGFAPVIVKDKDKTLAISDANRMPGKVGGSPDAQIRCVMATVSVDKIVKIFAS
ncbi:hypothetical protein diail_11325 [Diaporthe ilicicola]|nr:hypothetical protein diail_11325 [Diaporthe ilicicola]